MLAKVQQFPTLTEDPSTQSIEVNFNSTAVPLASQFTFKSSTGKAYLFVNEQTTISVTLGGGATFSSVPVIWQNCPSNGAPAVIMSSDHTTISFLVPAPTHYFVPWIFNLQVNFGSVNNITSPSFFLVKSPSESPFNLCYNDADGSFTFQRGGGEADILLSTQKLLINVLPYDFRVVLTGATFHGTPIVFSNGKPSWIDVVRGPFTNALDFSFQEPINGQSTGFQFAIYVPDGQGGEITILSPDPILINATIGDG